MVARPTATPPAVRRVLAAPRAALACAVLTAASLASPAIADAPAAGPPPAEDRATAPDATAEPCVEITVHNVRSDEGKVVIGVFGDATRYEEERDADQLVIAPASTGTVLARICALDPGTYALSVFHDENDNRALDTTRFGIPREGYGFSNGVRPRTGKPRFDRVAFAVTDDGTVVVQDVHLIYWF